MRMLKCIKGRQTATGRALYFSIDAACFAVRTTGK